MADWWLDDDQIASSYRCAADRVEQVKILGQLCSATRKEVLRKLYEIGSIDDAKYDELVKAVCDRRRLSPEKEKTWMSLYKSGYSDAAIGKLLNTPQSTIKNWRARAGLPANNPALSIDGIWRKQTRTKENAEVKR